MVVSNLLYSNKTEKGKKKPCQRQVASLPKYKAEIKSRDQRNNPTKRKRTGSHKGNRQKKCRIQKCHSDATWSLRIKPFIYNSTTQSLQTLIIIIRPETARFFQLLEGKIYANFRSSSRPSPGCHATNERTLPPEPGSLGLRAGMGVSPAVTCGAGVPVAVESRLEIVPRGRDQCDLPRLTLDDLE